jgi:hypothetical protein
MLILRLRSDVGVETISCTVVPEGDTEAWIYDYDTLLPKPCPWKGASPMSDVSYQHLKNESCFVCRLRLVDLPHCRSSSTAVPKVSLFQCHRSEVKVPYFHFVVFSE